MKRCLLLSIICLSFSFAYTQNLITNPGFENGLSEWNFWTRDQGVGTATIVQSPVHSGSNAVFISHWGPNDWSFKQNANFQVNTGDIYEFSAWIKSEQIVDFIEMSFALFDADGNSISWSYNATELNINDNYILYTTRLAIPDGVAYIWPRFVGNDSCAVFIDDVSFMLTGLMAEPQIHHLENTLLGIDIFTPSFRMEVTDKISGGTYTIQPTDGFNILQTDSTDISFAFQCNFIAADFPITIQLSLFDNALDFVLQADPDTPLAQNILFPGPIESKPGDFLIIPRATGMILPVEEQYPFWQFDMYDWKSTMAFAGVTNLNTGYMVATYDPWDSGIEFPAGSNNLTTFRLVNEPTKHTFGYNRHFTCVFFSEGGYQSMAQWYRNYAETNGYVKTFVQKTIENPNIVKLKGAIDFWALDWHFRQPEFIDSLYNFGIDRALISLTGSWGNYNDFSEIINTINDHGMLSSRYDIYTDVWPPASPPVEGYRTEGYPEDVVVQEDGSLLEGWLAILEGGTLYQGYYTCAYTHPDYAREWIAEELTTDHYNARFIDVELSSTLTECYSTEHPANRHEDGMNRKELLNVVKNEFNLVTGSEEARDFAFPVVDFGEGTMSIMPADSSGYDWTTPTNNPGLAFLEYNMNAARRIPLHGLVFHDVHVPTWYTGDGLSKVPAFWDKKDLFNILYASMPLVAPPNYAYWQQHRERFLTSMNVTSAVSRATGFSRMTSHRFITSNRLVQTTSFDNEWNITGNFGTENYNYNGILLPPDGFVAGNNAETVYKILNGIDTLAVAHLSDRLFFNPYGTETTINGLRSTGSILMKKYSNYLDISFIGNQGFIDIDPSQFPWPMQSISVIDLDNQQNVVLIEQEDNWVRFYKNSNHLFYRINGDFLAGTNPFVHEISFKVKPNPASDNFTVEFSLPRAAYTRIRLRNIYGMEVSELTARFMAQGKNSLTFHTMPAPGVYIIELEANSIRSRQKLVITN